MENLESGTVLFILMICKGVICKGLDRTKMELGTQGRKISRVFKPIVTRMLPFEYLVSMRMLGRLEEASGRKRKDATRGLTFRPMARINAYVDTRLPPK